MAMKKLKKFFSTDDDEDVKTSDDEYYQVSKEDALEAFEPIEWFE